MKVWNYVQMKLDKQKSKESGKMVVGLKVVKWKLFPQFWNTYREGMKNETVWEQIKGFFILLKFYGNIVFSKNR